MTTTDLPVGLQTLVDKTKFKYRLLKRSAGLDLFTVNLADWNLSLTDTNPSMWVRAADLTSSDPNSIAGRLLDAAREQGWDNQTVLVFLDAPMPTLRDHLPEAFPTWVLIDDVQQRTIQRADSPSFAMTEILRGQMPRLDLAPYEVSKPVTGSRFFGRKPEINEVLRHPNNNYTFIGIRRIGKTSLLKEIKRRVEENLPVRDGQTRCIYVDCSVIKSEEDFLRQIAYTLDQAEYKQILSDRAPKRQRYRTNMFARFAALHGGAITYLLDEMDRMLEEIGVYADLFDVLRAAWTAGHARFIMAGFVKSMRAYTNDKTAFFNLSTVKDIGSLDEEAVRRMVLVPMQQLGVKFPDPDAVVSQIYRETGGLPNYVQHYCSILLNHLDRSKTSELTVDDIPVVYSNRVFRDSIVETFEGNNELLEQIIVYALVAEGEDGARHDRFNEKHIDGFLRKRDLNFRRESLRHACGNLVRSGVLHDEGKGDYRFAVPLLRHALNESTNVDYALRKMREEALTDPKFSPALLHK